MVSCTVWLANYTLMASTVALQAGSLLEIEACHTLPTLSGWSQDSSVTAHRLITTSLKAVERHSRPSNVTQAACRLTRSNTAYSTTCKQWQDDEAQLVARPGDGMRHLAQRLRLHLDGPIRSLKSARLQRQTAAAKPNNTMKNKPCKENGHPPTHSFT